MPVPSVRRRVLTALAVLALPAVAVLTALPAQAKSMSFFKSSGRVASTSWLEIGTLPGGVPGNVHVGDLQVEELGSGRANVFGVVQDWTCAAGTLPGGGGHGEPDPNCTDEGLRFIEGGTVTFTLDRKLTTARLTGTLNVYGHDGPLGAPPVDITWTGYGNTVKSTFAGSDSDGTYSYSYRYTSTGRYATVKGNIGAMVYDNTPGETSSGWMGTFRSTDRSRTT